MLHGANATWSGTTDGDWQKLSNWGGAASVPGANEIATFNGNGNGNLTITNLPTLGIAQMNFNTSNVGAYTISGNITWSITANGGVSVGSGVTTNQDLSGIQFLRPTVNSTAVFNNQGSGNLKLGTIFSQNSGSGNTLAVLKFTPGASASIEIASGKLVDNAGTGGSKKVSVLLDDDGVLKMAATGTFDGTDAEGNSVTIHRGTYMAGVIGVIGTGRTSLGANGRIQFGQAGQTHTATLDYYNTGNATTDRTFHIIDNNTGVFKVSGGTGTNLTITSSITQSSSSLGGGKLTKDGVGTLTLGATSSYTGATVVNDGKLVVTGNISTSLSTTVNDGAALAGTGTVGGVTIENGGTLAPGLSAGTLTISGNLGLNATSNLAFELDPSSTTIGLGVNDLVTGVSNLTLDGLLAVTATSGSFTGVTSGTWRLINYTGTLTNNGLTLSSMPSLDAGYNWNLDLSTTGQVNLTIVPEPAFAVMGGFGILGLLRRRRSY